MAGLLKPSAALAHRDQLRHLYRLLARLYEMMSRLDGNTPAFLEVSFEITSCHKRIGELTTCLLN
jgi:hypothetical protein